MINLSPQSPREGTPEPHLAHSTIHPGCRSATKHRLPRAPCEPCCRREAALPSRSKKRLLREAASTDDIHEGNQVWYRCACSGRFGPASVVSARVPPLLGRHGFTVLRHQGGKD